MLGDTFVRLWGHCVSDEKVQEYYVKAGGVFGDAVSYLYLGECIGFADLLKDWERWEAEYARRGFRTQPIDAFVSYGGYNTPIEGIGTKRDTGEVPIFHAKIYSEQFLGKVTPLINLGDMIKNPRMIEGHYALPSTKDVVPRKE